MIKRLLFSSFIGMFCLSALAESTPGTFAKKLICAVDVSILEGSSISFCQGEFNTINASSGFVSYTWSGPQTGNTPSLAPTVSGQYVVSAVDGIGCVSTDTIQVTIHPNPIGVIVSSEGTSLCPGDAGTNLSLTQAYASYLWGGGSTGSSLLVNQGGTYTVHITDFNGCEGNSSITINQPVFDLSPLGTTTVCNGSTATLIASGGTSYLWSTGETGPTIIVSPSTTTNYTVTISNGTCTQTLSETITKVTMPESEIQDTFFLAEGDVVFVNGPSDYTTYNWTPTVNLSQYNAQGATFEGEYSTAYQVASSHTNGCSRLDSIWVIILKLTIPTGFSPNGDLVNDTFVIPELDTYKGKVTLFNRWGDKVFESDHYLNDWDGTCQTGLCLGEGILPEGTYFYSIEVENVHFDGYTTLKR